MKMKTQTGVQKEPGNRAFRSIPKEMVFLLILAIFPLRHILIGIDLWDTGYHYANFEYMGLEHMDSMWLYSTYLANAVGHLMTLLPGGHTLVGMNFYTGLTASVLGVGGYLFCTRKLYYRSWVVFLGELAALCLCWCPTAALYNYLTYIGFLGCVILLYCGLTEEKRGYLIGAGACLGANILVRFSNLPEAGLILAVWVYAGLAARQRRENVRQGIRRALGYTGWCLLGYLVTLLLLLGFIHMKYGITDYIDGISRLFAMTDSASDYKATSMISGMIYPYVENMYWVIRISIIIVAGTIACTICYLFFSLLCSKLTGRADGIVRTGAVLLAGLMLIWLYVRGFCSLQFYSYGAILRPGILFLVLTILIACIRIFKRKNTLQDRLISGILILVIFLTSLGSNNGIYPSLNNLFLAAPYTFHKCLDFLRMDGKLDLSDRLGRGRVAFLVSAFPMKAILTAFLGLFLFQAALFGKTFVFAESTGVQNTVAQVSENETLKGIRMSPDKAENLQGLSDYCQTQNLQGRELISYGRIPAVSFYLQMPPAFNSWCDLDSFQVLFMQNKLNDLEGKIASGEKEKPVIILDKKTGGIFKEMSNNAGNSEDYKNNEEQSQRERKLKMLYGFANKLNYELTYENAGYVVFE